MLKHTLPITFTLLFIFNTAHGDVNEVWIEKKFKLSRKLYKNSKKESNHIFKIDRLLENHKLKGIVLTNSETSKKVISKDYSELKKEIKKLPKGSFIKYHFECEGVEALTVEQIISLSAYCNKLNVHLLLFPGG